MSISNDSSAGEVFRKVIEANESKRKEILDNVRPSVRVDVEQLLALDAEAEKDGLLDSLQVPVSEHGRFLPGTQITDRYRIVSLAGRGGMGEVYRADDLQIGEPVALKFPLWDFRDDQQQSKRFYAEVRSARQVTHPSVCQVYDVGEFEGETFISMEYIDGEDLKSLLHRIGRLSHEKAIELGSQICNGIAAAHAKGVLHRDLKPSNVMIDGKGRARITDFGLAYLPEKESRVDQNAGTPAYMAPEQLLNSETNVQSDLYSLGLILFELFTGQYAHPSGSMADLVQLHERKSGPIRPSDLIDQLDPAVDVAIRRCLDSDPGERPKTAASVAAMLTMGNPLYTDDSTGDPPSPELLATFGERGLLSPTIASLMVAAVFAGLISLLLLSGTSRRLNISPLPHPEILQQDARWTIEQFGYSTDLPDCADWASGFMEQKRYDVSNSCPVFWYRQSPAPLIGTQIPLEAKPANYGTIVDLKDPPWTQPGMIALTLTSDCSKAARHATLKSFRAIPLQQRTQVTEDPPVDWKAWFGEEIIGFDLEKLQPAKWRSTPPDAFDQQFAWEGEARMTNVSGKALAAGITPHTSAPISPAAIALPRTTDDHSPSREEPSLLSQDSTPQRIYVEAASYRGRPTYFHVMTQAEFDEEVTPPTEAKTKGTKTGFGLQLSNVLTVLAIAFFARRNWRLRRCDRAGAAKIATFVLAGQMFGWLCLTSHTFAASEYFLVREGLKSAIGSAFTAWVVYLALEPFVRMHVPNLLVSWSRLIDGKWHDPIVGRDILFALAAAVWGEVLLAGIHSLPNANRLEILNTALNGWSGVFGLAIGGGANFVTWMLIIFTTCIMIYRFSGQLWLTCAFIAVGTGLSVAARDGNLSLGYLYIGATLFHSIGTVRFGLLFLVSFAIFDNWLQQPITTDTAAFYFPTTVFWISIFVFLTSLTAFISLGSRRKTLLA